MPLVRYWVNDWTPKSGRPSTAGALTVPQEVRVNEKAGRSGPSREAHFSSSGGDVSNPLRLAPVSSRLTAKKFGEEARTGAKRNPVQHRQA